MIGYLAQELVLLSIRCTPRSRCSPYDVAAVADTPSRIAYGAAIETGAASHIALVLQESVINRAASAAYGYADGEGSPIVGQLPLFWRSRHGLNNCGGAEKEVEVEAELGGGEGGEEE